LQTCKLESAKETNIPLFGLENQECGGKRTEMCASSFPQTVEELNANIESGKVVSHASFKDSTTGDRDFTIEELCSNFDKNKGTRNPVCM
jgi:hypothetical protein